MGAVVGAVVTAVGTMVRVAEEATEATAVAEATEVAVLLWCGTRFRTRPQRSWSRW